MLKRGVVASVQASLGNMVAKVYDAGILKWTPASLASSCIVNILFVASASSNGIEA